MINHILLIYIKLLSEMFKKTGMLHGVSESILQLENIEILNNIKI